MLAHSQTIADQGEKKGRHCEVHSSRRASSTATSPWPRRRRRGSGRSPPVRRSHRIPPLSRPIDPCPSRRVNLTGKRGRYRVLPSDPGQHDEPGHSGLPPQFHEDERDDRFPQGDQFLIDRVVSQGLRVRSVTCRRDPSGRQALESPRDVLLLLGSQRDHGTPAASSLDTGTALCLSPG